MAQSAPESSGPTGIEGRRRALIVVSGREPRRRAHDVGHSNFVHVARKRVVSDKSGADREDACRNERSASRLRVLQRAVQINSDVDSIIGSRNVVPRGGGQNGRDFCGLPSRRILVGRRLRKCRGEMPPAEIELIAGVPYRLFILRQTGDGSGVPLEPHRPRVDRQLEFGLVARVDHIVAAIEIEASVDLRWHLVRRRHGAEGSAIVIPDRRIAHLRSCARRVFPQVPNTFEVRIPNRGDVLLGRHDGGVAIINFEDRIGRCRQRRDPDPGDEGAGGRVVTLDLVVESRESATTLPENDVEPVDVLDLSPVRNRSQIKIGQADQNRKIRKVGRTADPSTLDRNLFSEPKPSLGRDSGGEKEEDRRRGQKDRTDARVPQTESTFERVTHREPRYVHASLVPNRRLKKLRLTHCCRMVCGSRHHWNIAGCRRIPTPSVKNSGSPKPPPPGPAVTGRAKRRAPARKKLAKKSAKRASR